MVDELHAQRAEHLRANGEACADHDGVGVDAGAVGELDCGDTAVVAGDETPGRPSDHLDTGGEQQRDLRMVGGNSVVQHDRVPIGQLAEQGGRVQPHLVGDHVHDAAVAHLVAVTERAVDDIATPVIGDAVDVGQHVDEPSGRQHPAGDDRVAAGQFDAEAAVGGPGDVDGSPGEHFAAIAAHLVAADRARSAAAEGLRGRGSRACARPGRCAVRRRRRR